MSDDLEFIVIDDIPEYIFCIGDDEENERVIALSGKDGAFKYEKVAELPTTGEDGVLYLVPKSHTTQTASGNPINVNIADGAGKIESLKLDGDTAQQTYTGQNLYNVATLSTGASVTKDDDGWITITKDNSSGSSASYTNAWTDNLDLETSTQYAIFLEVKEASGTGEIDITSTNSTQGQFSSWQSKQIASLTTGTYKIIATTKSSFSGIYGGLRTILNLSAGQSASITFRLSVLADTSVGVSSFVYEPYTGGQASPSPSYPQDINVVTGSQTVSINSTDYSIDLGSIELCKLGTYQDYIYKDVENWKVHKATSKVTFSSSSGWSKSNSTANNLYINQLSGLALNSPLACNKLTVYESATLYSSNTIGLCYNTTGAGYASMRIGVGIDSGIDTINKYSSWLAQTMPTVYYALATATDTTITDTTLIAQLEAIRTAALESGSNTISNTATGTNLAGDLEIGYYGYDPLNKYDKYFWLDVDGAYESL